MLDDRDRRLDVFALVLLALTAFLAISLLTYDRADYLGDLIFPLDHLLRTDALVEPPNAYIQNGCGWSGAFAAEWLLTTLGVGAYFFVGSLATFDIILLLRRPVDTPLMRLVGWLASLLAICTLATMWLQPLAPGPVIGPGGYLGALGRAVLESHFATIGGTVLAACLLMGGVLLCTDYYLVQLAILGLAFLGQRWGRRATSGRKKRDGQENRKRDESGVPVRIRGRNVNAVEDESADDELEDEDEEVENENADDEYEQEEEYEEELDETDAEEAESAEVPVKKAKAAEGKKSSLAASLLGFGKNSAEQENAREEVIEQLEEASRYQETLDYELPTTELLREADDFSYDQQEREVRRKAKILEKTFADFGFQVKVVEVETGPVIAQYEVELEAGLRLSKITSLADDLAIALRVPSVRIVAPIPGKNTVGIEVPNSERQIVRLREVMDESDGRIKKMRIPLFLGKDVSGNPMTVDLSTLPHLLIAGRTGTGKSVCLNAIIASILMTRGPDEVRMLMIDPKMVELSGYKTLPHLMHPVVTDMRKAEAILAWAVDKMEERYELLARAGVRHVSVYNQLGDDELYARLQPEDDEQRQAISLHLPFIVIVADEMADLMMTSGKEVEQHIIRLAQKSRAVGIHLILATQKPTVDVITGLIKSNLPARIAFQVASRTDSRVVLDEMGADKLLGNGDMLFLWPGTSTLLRGQGTFLGDDEINQVVDFVSTGEQNFEGELVHLKVEASGETAAEGTKDRDELYRQAVEIVIREGRGSVSLLQRALSIGYGRAARLVDFMAEDGIVGNYAGSQAREVLMTLEQWQQQTGDADSTLTPEPPPAKPRRSNRILPMSDLEDDSVQEVTKETNRPDTSATTMGSQNKVEVAGNAEEAAAKELDHDDDTEYEEAKHDGDTSDEEDGEYEYEEGEFEEAEYEEETEDGDEYESDEFDKAESA